MKLISTIFGNEVFITDNLLEAKEHIKNIHPIFDHRTKNSLGERI